jgi:hypothetical protein
MVRQSIAGLGVTTINFKCSDRIPLFKQGQRVSLLWTDWLESDHPEYDNDSIRVRFLATVLSEKGTKFIVRVDDMDDLEEGIPARNVFKNDDLVVKARPEDMAWTDEPDRTICLACCGYLGETNRCYADDGSGGTLPYWPAECINKDAA